MQVTAAKCEHYFFLSDIFKSNQKTQNILNMILSILVFQNPGRQSDATLGAGSWLRDFKTTLTIIRGLAHEPWMPVFGIAAFHSSIC